MADPGAASSLVRFGAFAGVLGRTVGAPAARRIVPLWAGIFIAGAVIFGPTGMRARDVVEAAWASPGLHAGLWLAWLVAAAPAVRAVLDRETTGYLRSLPVARGWWVGLQAAMLLALQLPWGLLWVRGAGVAQGLAAAGIAAAAGAAIARLPLTDWVRGAVARRRPDAGRRPVSGLAIAHLRAVTRSHQLVGLRGALVAAVGGGFAGLLVRANEMVGGAAASVSLAVGAVSLAIACGGIGAPIVESQQGIGWLVASTGVGRGVALGSALLVACGLGVAFGLAHAAALAGVAGGAIGLGGGARLGAEAGLLGGALAALALRAARWAVRREGIDGTRIVAAMTGIALATIVGLLVIGEAAVGLVALAAVAATALGAEGRSHARGD
jgi:hypothetical protein